MLRHACSRAVFALEQKKKNNRNELANDLEELLVEFKSLWLARNRPGGLKDSLERFEIALVDYSA